MPAICVLMRKAALSNRALPTRWPWPVRSRSHKAAWAATTPNLRAQILYYFAENLEAARAQVGATASNEDFDAAIQAIFTFAAKADKFDGQVHPAPFKGVVYTQNEGIGVIGIVCGNGAPLVGTVAAMSAAIWGAIAAGVVVIGLGVALKHPLTQVPENTMKFGVGAMLTTFGVFWSAEGLGTEWPGDALSLFGILAVVLLVSWASLRILKALLPGGAQVGARNV